VVCWGYNGYGQLTVPAGLTSVAQVSGGYEHTCALKTHGTVVCWGWNAYGQATVPTGLTSVAQVSAGGFAHTCALKTDGTVVCWGRNIEGQATVPAGLASVAQVSAGLLHTCALKTDGTVVCWGDNSLGETTVPAGLNLIVAAPQSISFTSISPSPALVGATYAVTATATSGLPVAFSTSTPGTCSVSGGTVTFIAVGICTVAADQAGDATHLAAPEQTQSITIITAAQGVLNLTTTIAGMGLPGGVATSLSAPLNNINTNNSTASCGKLNAFINQVNAKVQNGQLTTPDANQLLQAANAIKASLGCA
jgi:hypothetical protein